MSWRKMQKCWRKYIQSNKSLDSLFNYLLEPPSPPPISGIKNGTLVGVSQEAADWAWRHSRSPRHKLSIVVMPEIQQQNFLWLGQLLSDWHWHSLVKVKCTVTDTDIAAIRVKFQSLVV